MTELERILHAAERAGSGALITLVDISGSSYRRPGARMVVAADGTWSGAVSGGCLEGDVLLRAKRIIADGKPALLRYDTTGDEANVFGVGLGCNGILDMLAEPFATPAAPCIAALRMLLFSEENRAHVVVFRSENPEIPERTRWILNPDSPQPPDMPDELYRDCTAALASGRTLSRNAMQQFDALVEIVRPQTRLVIFGAGSDARPVAELAARLGWHVTVTDRAPAKAHPQHFPSADEVFAAQPEAAAAKAGLNARTVCVVMSHNFDYDREALRRIIGRGVCYVGLLGPRRRWEKLRAELEADGVEFSTRSLASIHAPAGLDLAAETPEEIALSIIAEIQATLYGGNGGGLRDKSGAIHAYSAGS